MFDLNVTYNHAQTKQLKIHILNLISSHSLQNDCSLLMLLCIMCEYVSVCACTSVVCARAHVYEILF
jgi:hypothetical protein